VVGQSARQRECHRLPTGFCDTDIGLVEGEIALTDIFRRVREDTGDRDCTDAKGHGEETDGASDE
jgi:hypothetical protein